MNEVVEFNSVSGENLSLGLVAIGRTDFEDGLWRGNHLLAGNGLQRVRTISEINATIVPGAGWTRFLQGQTKVQNSAEYPLISGINIQLLSWC